MSWREIQFGDAIHVKHGILAEGDLIVAMTEQGPGLLGSSALIPEGDKYLHNQRLGLVQILDDSLLDKRFLYYLFNTRTIRGQISGSATGTKVRHTAPERICRIKVSVPSNVAEQRKIGFILSAYDDLIENNRRRIQLLEHAARLLYKECFSTSSFPATNMSKSKMACRRDGRRVLAISTILRQEAHQVGRTQNFMAATSNG